MEGILNGTADRYEPHFHAHTHKRRRSSTGSQSSDSGANARRAADAERAAVAKKEKSRADKKQRKREKKERREAREVRDVERVIGETVDSRSDEVGGGIQSSLGESQHEKGGTVLVPSSQPSQLPPATQATPSSQPLHGSLQPTPSITPQTPRSARPPTTYGKTPENRPDSSRIRQLENAPASTSKVAPSVQPKTAVSPSEPNTVKAGSKRSSNISREIIEDSDDETGAAGSSQTANTQPRPSKRKRKSQGHVQDAGNGNDAVGNASDSQALKKTAPSGTKPASSTDKDGPAKTVLKGKRKSLPAANAAASGSTPKVKAKATRKSLPAGTSSSTSAASHHKKARLETEKDEYADLTSEELAMKLRAPGVMDAYISSKWIQLSELRRMETAGSGSICLGFASKQADMASFDL
jgi:hypothetical protein